MLYRYPFLKQRGIETTYTWPKSLSKTLQGNSYADTYSFIMVSLKRWSGRGWKSTNEINNAINGKTITLALVNTYFDLEDYSNPVKSYLDDRINVAITSGFTKTILLFAQSRNSIKNDDYLSFWGDPTNDRFVGLESYIQDIDSESSNDNALISFIFKLDPVQQQYTRGVYNFLQFSGDLGGVFQVLEIIGGIVVGIFAQKLFK